jgi:hypothetical protein
MTIAETDTIDIVAARADSAVVKLVITDHLGWGEFEAHAHLLQAKVNTYLAFVESGQLARVRSPKIPDDPEIHIVLALLVPPPRDAEALFARVGAALLRVGIVFDVDLSAAGT